MSFYTNFEFYQGEDREMIIDLKVLDKQIGGKYPYELLNTDTIEVIIPRSTGIDLIKTGVDVVIDKACQGRIKVALTGAETNEMISSTLQINVTRDAKKRIFIAAGAIVQKTIGNC